MKKIPLFRDFFKIIFGGVAEVSLVAGSIQDQPEPEESCRGAMASSKYAEVISQVNGA